MERQRFEDSWKEALGDAEMSPSQNLWTNIELDLEKAEGKKMKKRVLYFKLLAAASVAFAMTFAGIGYLYMNNQPANLVAENNVSKDNTEPVSPEKTNQSSNSNEGTTASNDASGQNKQESAASTTTERTNSSEASTATSPIAKLQTQRSGKEHAGVSSSDRDRSGLNTKQSIEGAEAKTSQHLPDNSNSVADNKQTTSSTGRDNVDRMFDSANEVDGLNRKPGDTQVAVGAVSQSSPADDERMFANAKLPEIVHVRKPAYQAEESKVDPVKQMLDRLAEEEKKYASNKKTKEDKRSKKGSEKLWTSLGVAAGSFNTVVSSQTGSAQMNQQFAQPLNQYASSDGARSSLSDNIVREQSHASGVSYAFGLSVGGKLSRRWVLQGGLSYMTQSSDYATNGLVSSEDFQDLKLGSITELNNAGKSDQLVNVAPYNVNTDLRFFNVPLQAGYLIIDRDFGLQFNAGVSTDVFLQSTLTPDGGEIRKVSNDGSVEYSQLEPVTQGAGGESPYRTLNFSGLIGTELSYRFGPHYRIAVNPGIRYPFSSIYKSEIAVDAMPLTFDVGLRFRYIFN